MQRDYLLWLYFNTHLVSNISLQSSTSVWFVSSNTRWVDKYTHTERESSETLFKIFNLCLMLTLLAPIVMQGSEHWVFIERNTSGLEELALNQISDIQKDETCTGPSEKQPTLDFSKVTSAVREVKTAEKREEKRSEESKTQMHKRAKMIASPEDFESLWEEEMYEKEKRKHSSETDSQTTEERDVQKDKTEAAVFASTESEEEKEPKTKIEAIAVASTKSGLTEEIETMVDDSAEPKEREDQKEKMEGASIISTEPERPTQSIKEPKEKSTDPEDFQAKNIESYASSWSQSTKEESKIIIQEHRTILTVSEKEMLKTTSDFESIKAKVKLSDKAVYSATERIIYIGSEETDQQDNAAEKIPDREKPCSSEKKWENQTNLDDEEETVRLAPGADSGEMGKDSFQSSSRKPTEEKSEIRKPNIRSDLSDRNAEGDKYVQSLEQCSIKKEKSSSILEEKAFVNPTACGTKDYKESRSCSSTEDSSHSIFHLSSQLKSGSPTREDELNLSSDQEQRVNGTHSSLQEGKVSDEKSGITTQKGGIIFTTSETERERNKLHEMEVSQILLQMEDIEATKHTLDSVPQQLSHTVDISKEELHKPQDLKTEEEKEQHEVLDSSKTPQAKLSETQESTQNKHTSSAKSASDGHHKLEPAAKNGSYELDFISIGRLQELEDEANANYIEVDQMAKAKPLPSKDSTEGKPSVLDNSSEVKKTSKAGSSEVEQLDRNEIHEIDKFSKEGLQELDKHSKVEMTAEGQIPELDDKYCEKEELLSLKNPVATTLDSGEQAHDRSFNLKKSSAGYLLDHAGSPDSTPPELRETLKDNSLLKEEIGNGNAVSPQTGVAGDNRECSQPSDVTAQSKEQLLSSSGKQKTDLEPLKLIHCGSCTVGSPEKNKNIAVPPGSDGDSLMHRSETNEDISVASKIKMFEQGEEGRLPFHGSHKASKKSPESCPSSNTQKYLPKMHIELQKDIPIEKNGAKVKSPLAPLDNKTKDPGETADVIYLAIAQGTSDGEPSQPSSWKEDISVGSEQGEAEGDAELASPDSGCEITLAEAVVTSPPPMNCPTGKFIKHVV